MTGKLILCGTPIGNLEDVTHRALRVLQEADVIACEDVRRTRKLLTSYSIKTPELVVYNDANERRQAPALVRRIRRGSKVVLVSDAGMPGLSDPGYRLVRSCLEAGGELEVVPGPSAMVTALAISGLPPGRFAFEGFLPRKQGERRRRIAELAADQRTLVFYVSPHRLQETLADLREGLGDRPAALAREMTKMYEEVRRASLSELIDASAAEAPRGEIVVVVGGAMHEHRPQVAAADLARRARALMDSGMERRQALAEVAKDAKVPRRQVFDALVEETGKAQD